MKDGLPGIATNLLTERLRRMEGDGIVLRVDGARSGPYALTDAGESTLGPCAERIEVWGDSQEPPRSIWDLGRCRP